MIQMVGPYAPHVAEELWSLYGHQESISYVPWPTFDPALCVEDLATISLQVNGKFRGTIDVAKTANKEHVLSEAKAVPSVAKFLDGKEIRRKFTSGENS